MLHKIPKNEVMKGGSIPTVIIGKDHEIKHISDGAVIAIPFSLEKGEFTVELCFRD